MDPVSSSTAIDGVIKYFENPSNHLDDDKRHVSKKELLSAREKVSAEAVSSIEAMSTDFDPIYLQISRLQKEGAKNDKEISMRDLYALRRGTGYHKEDILAQTSLITSEIDAISNSLAIAIKGLADLAAHFSAKENHTCKDPKYVTIKELEQVYGKISREADVVIDTISSLPKTWPIRMLDNEWFGGDAQISVKDLSAAGAALKTDIKPGKDIMNFRKVFLPQLAIISSCYGTTAAILNNAGSIQKETQYIVNLKRKRHDDPADGLVEYLVNAVVNKATADDTEIMVDKKTFDQCKEGQVLSRKSSLWDILDGVEYTVTISSKREAAEYSWTAKDGSVHAISADDYKIFMNRLKFADASSFTVPFNNVETTYLNMGNIEDLGITDIKPLKRCFVEIKLENKSTLTIEVPQRAYDNAGELWSPENEKSGIIAKGKLSKVSGKIVKKWTEPDDKFVAGIMPDGTEIILPVEVASKIYSPQLEK
ncbi:MAG: hypothetical protein WC527_05350 [Candidatus Margulisiibacteriota bacterium]